MQPTPAEAAPSVLPFQRRPRTKSDAGADSTRRLGRLPSRELANALLALVLEVGPLLAAQLRSRLAAEPPLTADPPPVARGVQLAQHRQHARLHAAAHHLVGR